MAEKNEIGSKRAGRQKSLLRQICKGDLVTIRDKAGERKGHATGQEYGNWVLVLERNAGTALATKENTVAVCKPKKLAQRPKVGQRPIYDDGRRTSGEVVEVGPRSMYVRFDSSTEPSLIHFDDPAWMDYITFDKFSEIQFDMVEAGNCFALERGTACMFHLMRIMEVGVQRLGSALGITLVTEKHWQNILDEVNKVIKSLDAKNPKTKALGAARICATAAFVG